MLANAKEIKILLYGKSFPRNYRSRVLINFLQESRYCISQVYPDFYWTKTRLSIIFCWIELLIKAAFADVIYLLPKSGRFIKSALWAARIFNKKLVVEMHISLYDNYVKEHKSINADDKEAKAIMKHDILALTKSDYIIHSAKHELNYWEKLLGINIDQNKVFIAPNCNASTTLTLKRSFMQDGVLRICWWGTFIPLHGLDKILQAMKILKEKEVPFRCTLFGVDKPIFYTYAEKIQLEALEDHVFLRKDLNFPSGSLPMYLVDNCDLALGIFGDGDAACHALPNKLNEALSMGIPTLTMNAPALREFFNPETDFWTCEPSPESIAESILVIAGGAAYPVDWEQTRQKVLNTFSVARYQEVVSKVLEKTTGNLLGGKTLDGESGGFATYPTALNQVKQ
jgi:glycosyltransferase involved in cell wall biosynthesis